MRCPRCKSYEVYDLENKMTGERIYNCHKCSWIWQDTHNMDEPPLGDNHPCFSPTHLCPECPEIAEHKHFALRGKISKDDWTDLQIDLWKFENAERLGLKTVYNNNGGQHEKR